jgi:hypothetical protein
LLTIDRHPTEQQLRRFGVLLAIFVPLFGGLWWWRTGRLAAGEAIWAVGGVLAAIYLAAPRARRMIYLGWMYAAFPIGWTVSHLLMGVVYYLIITPIGVIMRASGRDPLSRRFDRTVQSYWTPHAPVRDVGRYFRQY